MTTNEYQDRLLLAIITEDKKHDSTDIWPLIDVAAAAEATGLPPGAGRLEEAVEYYELSEWVKVSRAVPGGVQGLTVTLEDAGREQEKRIRQEWPASLSFRQQQP